jgi:muramoyltetrapeptide carboxypeptidase
MPIPVHIPAASSAIGPVELAIGVQRLRDSGFEPLLHSNVLQRHYVSAGTDAQRLAGVVDSAFDPRSDIVWMGRGGYGAGRLLPLLDEVTRTRGVPPRKLLVGYSDVTPLHHFVRSRWGWDTLHAVMVSASKHRASDVEWRETCALVRGELPALAYASPGTLRWVDGAPKRDIKAELVGGNLSLWHTLAGTPWQPDCREKIVFLEDLDEKLYAIDRYVVQIEQSGMFDGAAAIVLGDFTACRDEANTILDTGALLSEYAAPWSPEDPRVLGRVAEGSPDVDWDTHPRVPQRKVWDITDGLIECFGRVARRLGVQLAMGLPVGHGPNFHPLPLGARYTLTPDGSLRLIEWPWMRRAS